MVSCSSIATGLVKSRGDPASSMRYAIVPGEDAHSATFPVLSNDMRGWGEPVELSMNTWVRLVYANTRPNHMHDVRLLAKCCAWIHGEEDVGPCGGLQSMFMYVCRCMYAYVCMLWHRRLGCLWMWRIYSWWMSLCVYVCMCVYIYVHVHIRSLRKTCTSMYVRSEWGYPTFVCIYVYISTLIYIYIHMKGTYLCVHARGKRGLPIYVCMYI